MQETIPSKSNGNDVETRKREKGKEMEESTKKLAKKGANSKVSEKESVETKTVPVKETKVSWTDIRVKKIH
jgi:hypothetical protein